MNKVFLLGRLGHDPEIRYTLNGTPVAQFRLATNEIYSQNGEKEVYTEWHHIVVFGKQAELCGLYLRKGSKVFIEGKLRTRSFETRQGQIKKITEIWAEKIIFLDPVKHNTQDHSTNDDTSLPYPFREDEDIPF